MSVAPFKNPNDKGLIYRDPYSVKDCLNWLYYKFDTLPPRPSYDFGNVSDVFAWLPVEFVKVLILEMQDPQWGSDPAISYHTYLEKEVLYEKLLIMVQHQYRNPEWLARVSETQQPNKMSINKSKK